MLKLAAVGETNYVGVAEDTYKSKALLLESTF
jgi:hypothetical protein